MAAFARCERILTDHRDQLDILSDYLVEHEKIDGDDFILLMEGKLSSDEKKEAVSALPESEQINNETKEGNES